ncbi:acylphosphatase [Xanthomonas campestris pv. campestris]|uniref:acylphosphatase n=1 Tax=Xanthomonas TaxID=338 RepID=UPI0008A60A02|nr:acylphosphatase [Xanthomonas campestris]MCC5094042.1 acylphosphatase [Xanthomonas campestris pv. incanae]MCC5095779.1 acylphosphatase [Xanthomonas campestris]MCF8808781.1 acylphosphatase [Xanthomonas campestris pv. campestris]MDX6080126.1 acylphosphatase [Xanthomonas campestris pv. incanae]MDX6087512.1 acylphosphatase [Xanthomonas campestris pv. incanae]
MQAARFIVTGVVQGVFFRASTRERALALQLRGHARNQADSSVEVVAAGSAAALEALEHWLWQGSPASKVASVTRTPCAIPTTEAFVTG